MLALGKEELFLEKFLEGIRLNLNEIRWLNDLFQFTEVDAFRHGQFLVRLCDG
jgi:hypothetical protein